jgi:peptide/nickel transport system permease protein
MGLLAPELGSSPDGRPASGVGVVVPRVLRWRDLHPMFWLVRTRLLYGLITLLVVSVIVFLFTELLPGNAAYAVLGHSTTPQRLHLLEMQMHLNRPAVVQYWTWFSGLFTGRLGNSLVSGTSVWALVAPRLANSACLVVVTGIIGSIIGIALGAVTALTKDSWFDHITSVFSLAVTSLPEFVVGIALIVLFSTNVVHLFPGVSFLAPGTYAWQEPRLLVLPVATLVLVIVPYIHRMMRQTMIEALESDYVEMARLKGIHRWRVIFVHALPNAIAPVIQAIGLNFLYLAGGIVVVEYLFAFPGIGAGLVSAVTDRDMPTIQFTVMILASFYVLMNILTDVIALAATPRRRIVR